MTHSETTWDPARYWRERAGAFGHTGWKRPVVYVYDQLERLAVVERRLRERPSAGTALDFGCGSGDFSRLLLRLGYDVLGHDPHMAPDISHPRFQFQRDSGALTGEARRFDVILSITVLDHVLDDGELRTTLSTLARLLSPTGRLLMLEYATDAPAPSPSPHQAYRSLDRWREHLEASSLALDVVEAAAHPTAAPSPGYKRYRRHLLTRLLNRVPPAPLVSELVSGALALQARVDLARSGPGAIEASPLKWLTCRRVEPK